MIDPAAKLSVSRQAFVLGISRGSVYYKPRSVSDADLTLMHRIGKLHMEFPFAALYRRPNTSKPAPGHKIYPYLLRKLPITRPNQVLAMGIPIARSTKYRHAIYVTFGGAKKNSWNGARSPEWDCLPIRRSRDDLSRKHIWRFNSFFRRRAAPAIPVPPVGCPKRGCRGLILQANLGRLKVA